jgi:hypothetical protein
MITRAKNGIFKPKHQINLTHTNHHPLYHALFTDLTPTTFTNAAKHSQWMDAMTKEMTALQINKTWDLVPRPSSGNIVGLKWVFRT